MLIRESTDKLPVVTQAEQVKLAFASLSDETKDWLAHDSVASPLLHRDLASAADRLFDFFCSGFDRARAFQHLSELNGLILGHAETELRVLDLYAAYQAIRRHDHAFWKRHGEWLFENLVDRIVGRFQDDARRLWFVGLIENRFAVYNRIAIKPPCCSVEGLSLGISICAAMIMPQACSDYCGPEHRDAEGVARFQQMLADLQADKQVLAETAAEVFSARFATTIQLLSNIAVQAHSAV